MSTNPSEDMTGAPAPVYPPRPQPETLKARAYDRHITQHRWWLRWWRADRIVQWGIGLGGGTLVLLYQIIKAHGG